MVQNNTFSTLFIGQRLIRLSTIDSTNTYALNLLSNTKPPSEGTVILADNQTTGRGQQGNTWNSKVGESLTFSLILQPHFLPIMQQFELTIASSVGVCKAFQSKGVDVQLKWPNDIYVDGKKLGGMLIENQVQGNTIRSCVIGIGLNINQEEFSVDLPNPVAVRQLLGTEQSIDYWLALILEHIEAAYLQLKAGKTAELKAYYLQQLYLMNTPALFEIRGKKEEGIITGVGNQGHLQMLINGEEHLFDLKEVKFCN